MDAAFLTERIVKIKALIVAYEDALLALASGSVESYTLDTGQDRQTVTKMNVGTIERLISSLENKCAVYQARLDGSGTTHVRPAW